jgi:hypothetical protein
MMAALVEPLAQRVGEGGLSCGCRAKELDDHAPNLKRLLVPARFAEGPAPEETGVPAFAPRQ